jgi:cardiolipin synthase
MRPAIISKIPNIITGIRIMLVPVFAVLMMNGAYTGAFIVFIVAGLSDAIDGPLARRLNVVSSFGRNIDPIADKLLMVTAVIVLTLQGWLPLYFTVLVILRDALLLGVYFTLRFFKREGKVTPSIPGKLSTVLQITTIVYVMYLRGADALLRDELIYAATAMTVFSGLHYLAREVRQQLKMSAGVKNT